MLLLLLLIDIALIAVAICVVLQYRERQQIEQVTPIWRGERSERKMIKRLLDLGINPKAIFHDLYIQKRDGQYTQVDLVAATKSGLIVFEIKDYSGWIFGDERQQYWTQVLAYGRERHRFYNPIMQNAGHIDAIRRRLPNNPRIPIYSVIVFFGSSQFRNVTYSSPNTYVIYPNQVKQIVRYIMEQPPAAYGDKREIMALLSNGVANGCKEAIVCSQINHAQYAARNKPQSHYRSRFSVRYMMRRVWR